MNREYMVGSSSDDLWAAEQRVLKDKPEGYLMDRAAARLAVVCSDLLQAGPGRVYGARVVMPVGPGDNGGDALLAGAILRRRGVDVMALLVDDRAHP